MTINEQLLEAIKGRQTKRTEFWHGISTADRYVKTVQECVGLDVCYRYASKGKTSFNDVVAKAANTLVYANEDMEVQEKGADLVKQWSKEAGQEIELPKNTLLAFKHVLTTPRKDRDGDILRTQGAKVDPKLPLLWQHIHTLPIGKMVATVKHDENVLELVSAIIDINEVAHDAVVMLENGMGRFSHGFRALEFDKMKEEPGEMTGPGGFDIRSFEIMEESVVSVPSNVDAEADDIILSLVDNGKLTSGLMKAQGQAIRDERPITEGVIWKETMGDYTREIKTGNAAEFAAVFGSAGLNQQQENTNEDLSGIRSGEAETKGEGAGCACGGSPEETDEQPTETAGAGAEGTDKEVDDEALTLETIEENDEAKDAPHDDKVGRVLSTSNINKISEVVDDLGELEDHIGSRAGSALCKGCVTKLKDVLKSAGTGEDDEDDKATEPCTQETILRAVVTDWTVEERAKLASILKALDDQTVDQARIRQFRSLLDISVS